jgi:hypothetical protein
MPKLISVIESEICRGKGTAVSPYRTVRQYYSPEGEFLAENDPEIYGPQDIPPSKEKEIKAEQ